MKISTEDDVKNSVTETIREFQYLSLGLITVTVQDILKDLRMRLERAICYYVQVLTVRLSKIPDRQTELIPIIPVSRHEDEFAQADSFSHPGPICCHYWYDDHRRQYHLA